MGTRSALVTAALLAATTIPASGQTTAPVGAGSASPIPDLSGTWSHPYIPNFEPPPSGPGPVLNTARVRQVFDANGRPLPSTSNVRVGNPSRLVGDHANPILKPAAAEVVKKRGETSLAGAAFPTPFNQCWPAGVPYIFENLGLQLLQQPDKVTILYPFNHEFRQIRFAPPHPAHVTPSWYGDSVGHYEGDTLVVDTVGIKVGPFSMVDWYGTPHTEALHVVERYRLLDYEAALEYWERNGRENFRIRSNDGGPEVDPTHRGKVLQLQFTVEDDAVFTAPWSATVTYWRALEETHELVCAENRREYYAARDTAVPTAAKPDF
jgi:hypothetical protein